LFPASARYCPLAMNSVIVRRAVVEAARGFDTSYRTCGDWDFWQRIARSGAHFTAVAEELAVYRMRPGSLSRDGAQVLQDGLRVLAQGHAPDPRVPDPHPAYAGGVAAEQLSGLKLAWSAWPAGLLLGRGSDAGHLLSFLRDEACPSLSPTAIAESLLESMPLPTCQTPAALYKLWPDIEQITLEFLDALEALSGTRGLARRAAVVLERMVLQHATAEQPVAMGTSYKIRIEITEPFQDILPPPSTIYLYCFIQIEGVPIGTVELPVIGGCVQARVLADAIAAEFSWTILGHFFIRTVYTGSGGNIPSNPREEALAHGRLQELHDRTGWTVFLQELWNHPDWPPERFYDAEFAWNSSTERQLQSRRIQLDVSKDFPNVEFNGSEVEVEVQVGGTTIGVVTVPTRNDMVRAQELQAAVTTACGFELCVAAVREGLLGHPLVLTHGMNSLRGRLASCAAASATARRPKTTHWQPSEEYASHGLLEDETGLMLGRRTPQLFGTSASRYAALPLDAAADLLTLAGLAGEPVVQPSGPDGPPTRVIYRPDLIPPGFPYRQPRPSVASRPGAVPSENVGISRNPFEALFVAREDPWNYTSPYEQTKYEQTLSLLPSTPIRRALEIGCAEGHFTVQLAPQVQRLVAVDISQIALERAAERCKDLGNITYETLDLTNEPLPGRFDLIVCSEVLYYVGEVDALRAVAVKLAAALEPDGYLLMAHANLIVDEPDRPGFDWDNRFGAKVISETFVAHRQLKLVKEIRTLLYRIQLFQRAPRRLLPFQRTRHKVESITFPEQPTVPPPDITAHVRWNGGMPPPMGSADRDGGTARLPILMYHRVAPEGASALARYRVTPAAFEAQLRYLYAAGYYSAGLEEWRVARDSKKPLPGRAIVLTFDDGYRDFLTHAWPLLERYGFTATVFLVADRVGQHNHWDRAFGEDVPLLNWEEILYLQNAGIEFGSHTVSHCHLTALTAHETVREAARSRAILERNLKRAVTAFAYPYGDTNRAVQHLTGACGYIYGLTCRQGLSRYQDSLLALPRIEVSGSASLYDFIGALHG
ncbi:MAG: glycosyl transferase family 2, partial [Chloroflexi bacterium]|nr:glycosyl transferase family 2 [Chloroflexota bacterium]